MKDDLEFFLIPAGIFGGRKLKQIGSSSENTSRKVVKKVKLSLSLKLINFTRLIAVILMAAIQTSCVVYVPNVINAPLFSDKGEVQANLNIGESGFDPQLSAAVSDHVGLMLNGSFRTNNKNSAYGEVHNFIEAGAGYYTKLETIGRFEVYGGAGFGNLKATDVDFWTSRPDIEAKSFRIFVQSDVGVKTDYFDGCFNPRFVWLNLDLGTETMTNFFIEPAVTLKGGSKNIKVVFQFGYSIPTDYYFDNFYDPLLLSFGIQGTFGRKNIQSKKQPEPSF